MKISELPVSKAKLLGNLLPGMRNLAKHDAFPELVLKRAHDVKTAVQYGGVMIDLGLHGVLFFACQDAKQLLDTEVLLPSTAQIAVRPAGVIYTRGDGMTYYRVTATSADTSTVEPGVITADEVMGWCAVFTPCEGYGHSGIHYTRHALEFDPDYTVSLGSIGEGGAIGWGVGHRQIEPGNMQGSSMVLWREIPLRKTLGQIASRDGFVKDLVSHYPAVIRDSARDLAVEELRKVGQVPVSVLVSYCRGLDDIPYVGLGLANQFNLEVTEPAPRGIAVHCYRYESPSQASPFPQPEITYTRLDGKAFDSGFRSLTPSGKRQWNRLSKPLPDFGWKLGAGVVPKGIRIDETEINMRGLLRDFLPTRDSPEVAAFLSSATVDASEVPSLAFGTDTDNGVGERSAGLVIVRASVHNEDYVTHVSNVLARVDARLGDGTLRERKADRIWSGTAADTAKVPALKTYRIQFPGSKWSQGSKNGGQVVFSMDGNVTATARTTLYAGVQYSVVDIYIDGKKHQSFADAGVGAVTALSSSLKRGRTAFGGQSYGNAATADAPARPGVVLVGEGVEARKLIDVPVIA